MDSELTPWELYDLSAALQPDTTYTMRDHFRRFHASQEKPIEGAGHTALQRSWCAFIRRWNRMTLEGESFPRWLAYREQMPRDHSLTELRQRGVCKDVWYNNRLCFVHLKEGCLRVIRRHDRRSSSGSRSPSARSAPLDREVQPRALQQATNSGAPRRRGSRRGWRSRFPSPARRRQRWYPQPRSRSQSPRAAPRRRLFARARSRSREQHLERHERARYGAPMYRPPGGIQTSARDKTVTAVPRESWYYNHGHGDEYRGDFGDPRYAQQSSGYCPPSRQSAVDLHGGMVSSWLGGGDVEADVNRSWDAHADARGVQSER
ncbi:hypothetical protein PHMEG_0002500 [Phytophthora megakarya]|uniref:Uncharacterized protein n=1 Tax=Phytophthora megakarya TaxID=4795 RepID=A0A225WY38_9STRA|nr:hypothetical protein PHMEG_0002500 [Phytophthora megakarya]